MSVCSKAHLFDTRLMAQPTDLSSTRAQGIPQRTTSTNRFGKTNGREFFKKNTKLRCFYPVFGCIALRGMRKMRVTSNGYLSTGNAGEGAAHMEIRVPHSIYPLHILCKVSEDEQLSSWSWLITKCSHDQKKHMPTPLNGRKTAMLQDHRFSNWSW